MSVIHAAKGPVSLRSGRSRPSLVLGALIPAASGVLMSLLMPTGPVTPVDVIASMVVGAVVGVIAGWWLGRWALLWAPILFAGSYELARLWQLAPSLDGIHLDSGLGQVLFATTRGFHLVVGLLPMLAGVLVGSVARRRSDQQAHAHLPLIGTSLLILAIAAASFFISRPGRTEPILGPDGRELAGSIAEVGRVEIGGHQQTVIIRGQDATNPILLYLTGGPGNSDFGFTRTFLEPLEEDFVLVGWDQRGAGASYPALDPVSTLTLDSAVSDVIELSEYLTGRLDQNKIYVLGNSWGSIIGVLAVERRPDLFHAYIGSGQMVNPLETDSILNDQVKAYAERTGDEVLARKMELYGEPPYTDWQAYGTVLETYGDLEPYAETEEFARGVPGIQGTGTPEYGFMDKVNVFRGLVDMGSALYSQAQEIDLREDAPSLAVPVYFIQGSHELTARSGLAEEYAAVIEAPRVTVEVFDNSGHVPHFEEAGRFHRFLTDVVLADGRG